MRISVGKSRKDTNWKVQDLTWSELCQKLSKTKRTDESMSEYKSMSADDKSSIKDVGGFVGGVVLNGRRIKANVESRSLVTLDADFALPDVWEDVEMLFDYAICCYSTHTHTPRKPRLRFVIPLDREVTPEEYEPIARRLAADLGIDMFDITTYEASRLMYWPSTSNDGEFFFKEQKGSLACADDILARYVNWRDTTEWPLGSTEHQLRTKQAKAQGEPSAKPGVVGLFCRTYNIHEAIDTFLPDEYEKCQDENRYTYTKGTTSAGVVLYNNGQFAYSHHSTDPAGGVLCNSFDLVRLHMFGDLDYDTPKETPINKLPSYKAMLSFVQEDDESKKTLLAEKLEEAKKSFSEEYEEPEELEWATKLTQNDHGEYKQTTDNFVTILENDPNLAGKIALNAFKTMPCIIGNLPWHKCKDKHNGDQWSDEDSSALTHYIETTYNLYHAGKLSDALNVVMSRHSFHPVKDYLNNLEWDGIKRAEHLFIHYLGAEDNLYTRTVTRKWLTAAVARVMNPGCKFDNLVVLVGAQGIGKSQLGHKLGRGWFSDTFGTVQGKDAYEQLKGCWIIEIAELSAMKKAEVESVKMFISKQEDNYRGAYREYAKVNKRQCVFYGTTNDDSFLRDRTGNRRFWPIGVDKANALYDVFELTDTDMDQIWAEAVNWYNNNESLYLNAEVSAMAVKEQSKYMTDDPRIGQLADFLDKLLPDNWEDMSIQNRRSFMQGINFTDTLVGTVQRTETNVQEIAYELFGDETLEPYKAKEIHTMLTALPNWKKTGNRKRTPYGRQYVYERTE